MHLHLIIAVLAFAFANALVLRDGGFHDQACGGTLTKRAPVHFPSHLVNTTMDVEMHSGYVNVTSEDYLFYWFVRAQNVKDDAPVIVWSNGGPGCTAMEGATLEIGPLVHLRGNRGGFTGKLSANAWSWNKHAHLLFVDQPRYVGYSCGSGHRITSSKDAGKDMVTFLLGWRELFDEIEAPHFILASESYGGRFVPAWADAIMNHNEESQANAIPLAGLLLGNPKINASIEDLGVVEFLHRVGVQESVESLEQSIADDGVTQAMMESLESTLGYNFNMYDFRLPTEDCCGCCGYDYSSWSDWHLLPDVLGALHVAGDAGENAFGHCAGGCIPMPHFDAGSTFDFTAALGRALTEGIKVSVFFGMHDTACNYVSGLRSVMGIRWPGASEFAETPLVDLTVEGRRVGKVQAMSGLAYFQVEDSGHMVTIDAPQAASRALDYLLHPYSSRGIPIRRRLVGTGSHSV